MLINLVNIDSTIPNLALKKIEKFYLDQGATVEWDVPVMKCRADRVFVSCVFTRNAPRCRVWEGFATIGGSGYDRTAKLPAEIEGVKPRINWGFTTRGCIRKCPFCFVPEMEGAVRVVGDLHDLWDGKAREVNIMDNNILAIPEHFKLICAQARSAGVIVDFNQGLDIRLIYERADLVRELKTVRHRTIRFAWDLADPKMPERMEWARREIGQAAVYVIAGFEPFDAIMEKLLFLKKIGHRVYLMRHESVHFEKRYIELARWTNQQSMFAKKTFDEFLAIRGTTLW